MDKLNLQPQYLSASSQREGSTIEERRSGIPSTRMERAHPAPNDLKVAQTEPSANLSIKLSTPNPLDDIPMSADRRISAYQRITKLL
jgi:hypothetical protein